MVTFNVWADGEWAPLNTRAHRNGVWESFGGQSAPSLVRRLVGSLTRWSRIGVTLTEDTTYQSEYTAPDGAESLVLTYSYPYNQGAGSWTLASAVEYDGVLHPLTFGGAARSTVTDTDQWATSDTLAVSIPPGARFRVRTFGANGSKIMTSGASQGQIDNKGSGDLTVAGSGPVPVLTGKLGPTVGPVSITGDAPAGVSVAITGDSITEGGNDAQLYLGGGGYVARAQAATGVPVANYGVWASTHALHYQKRDNYYAGTLTNATHVLCALGVNDVGNATNGGWPLSTIQEHAVTHWAWLSTQCPRVYQTTITPMVTGAYDTLDGQILDPAYHDRRAGYNDWIRDGAPLNTGVAVAPGTAGAVRAGEDGHPLSGVVEVADSVESSRNSGKWSVSQGPLTGDGGHPNTKGHELMAVSVTAWLGALTA